MIPSFGIIAPNYKRPKILNLWCEQIARLRSELDMFIPACVISDKEDEELCRAYDITHITHDNQPVSEKFNAGAEWIGNMGYEYMIIMGSDDVMSTDTLSRIITKMKLGYDVIGIDSIYFYGTTGVYKGKLCQLKGKRMLGVCKTIHSRVLRQIGYRPWGKDKNFGLDALATQTILPYAKSYEVLSDTVVCDCKSDMNMNKITLWMKKLPQEDPQKFLSILSAKELGILKSL